MGAQFHCNWTLYTNPDRVAVVRKLAEAGVTWVRIDTAWSGIEDTGKGARNSWYIGMVDFCVNEARKAGLQVLVTLWLTPGWANGGQSTYVPPADARDYADFARWAAGYWKGRVAAWEVWNEPDPSQSFWQGTTAQYAQLLKTAYPGFKAGDPNALVVLGGPASNNDGWIRELYRLGVKGSFDVLATHPYQAVADYPPEKAGDSKYWWFNQTPRVKAVMDEYGDGAKPIWFTEFGWSAHANWDGIAIWQRGVTPEQQADYAVRAVKYSAANFPYVTHMFWYKERARSGSTGVHEDGAALLSSDLAPRPVYFALRALLK